MIAEKAFHWTFVSDVRSEMPVVLKILSQKPCKYFVKIQNENDNTPKVFILTIEKGGARLSFLEFTAEMMKTLPTR